MIVFETALDSIIEKMPLIEDANGNTFKIRFDWGTQDVLNKFIVIPENVSKYPLIWLVVGKESHNLANKRITRVTKLVIAKNSDTPNEFNRFQYKTDFDKMLNPILENLIKALERSGISKIIDYDFDVERMPNFSEVTNETKTVAIWNAIVFEANIEMHGKRCIRDIKFN